MKKEKINLIGVSGGKDSTALMLWAKYKSGYDPASIKVIFCDTGNEHDLTYEHIEYLSKQILPIEWIKPEYDFYSLAEKKQRFPSPRARFCTQVLKIFPTRDYILKLVESNFEVLSHSGVRAGESEDRKDLKEFEFDLTYGCKVRRPLIKWTLEDILKIHTEYNIKLNPLYSYGASRVGCFPCIMSNKKELRIIGAHFEDRIELIEYWENKLNSTFYPPYKVPARFRSKKWISKKEEVYYLPTIRDVIAWSKTSHGAKQYLLPFEEEAVIACDMSGFCE